VSWEVVLPVRLEEAVWVILFMVDRLTWFYLKGRFDTLEILVTISIPEE
jgi:hypothetical protein